MATDLIVVESVLSIQPEMRNDFASAVFYNLYGVRQPLSSHPRFVTE